MAQVIDRREPVAIDERANHVHAVDDRRSNTGVIVALILLALLLLFVFGGSSLFGNGSDTTNGNVPTPATGTGQ